MKSIILFASGAGSNVKAIIDYFRNNSNVHIAAIFCNNPKAGVISIADNEKIPLISTNREDFKSLEFIEKLKSYNPTLIILAGFLWRIPKNIIDTFPEQIINLHPALLPKYGGKGMYGMNVHEAVKAAGEQESGITIHYVDEYYDNGAVIVQAKCKVQPEDTPTKIAEKIHRLEHFYLPRTIEYLLLENRMQEKTKKI